MFSEFILNPLLLKVTMCKYNNGNTNIGLYLKLISVEVKNQIVFLFYRHDIKLLCFGIKNVTFIFNSATDKC